LEELENEPARPKRGVAGGNAVFSTINDELKGMPRFKYD